MSAAQQGPARQTTNNPGGQPKWRRALLELVKDERELFRCQVQLALGRAIVVRDEKGRPFKAWLWNEKLGKYTKQAVRIVPDAAVIERATEHIANRCFGRPSQQVYVAPGGSTPDAGLAPMPELDPADRATLLEVAQRRALTAGRQVVLEAEYRVEEG